MDVDMVALQQEMVRVVLFPSQSTSLHISLRSIVVVPGASGLPGASVLSGASVLPDDSALPGASGLPDDSGLSGASWLPSASAWLVVEAT